METKSDLKSIMRRYGNYVYSSKASYSILIFFSKGYQTRSSFCAIWLLKWNVFFCNFCRHLCHVKGRFSWINSENFVEQTQRKVEIYCIFSLLVERNKWNNFYKFLATKKWRMTLKTSPWMSSLTRNTLLKWKLFKRLRFRSSFNQKKRKSFKETFETTKSMQFPFSLDKFQRSD